jgi:hypothetical protein
MGQVRRDHLPSLRSLLTDERHANVLRLRPASGDYPQYDSGVTETRTLVSVGVAPAKGLQEVGRRSHIRHCGVEPQVVTIWIKDGWHPVVDW